MTSPLETTHPLPAVVQPTPSPSVIRLYIPPPPAPPASRPIKRRWMARVAAEDAVTGPRDWGNDAGFGNPSSLSLLIDWLGSGKNFEAFKFGVKGKRQAQVAEECEAWLRERGCPSPRISKAIQRKVRLLPSLARLLMICSRLTTSGMGGRKS